MLLLGVGARMAFAPVLLAAMSDVERRIREQRRHRQPVLHDGRSLGLAVLASLAAIATKALARGQRCRRR
jgi:hypothetical protein